MTNQPMPPLGLGPDGLFYEYDAQAQVLNQRPYPEEAPIQSWPFATEVEAAQWLEAQITTAHSNRQKMLDFMEASRASNQLFLDKPNNTIVLIDVVRQVKDLTHQNNRMMRLWTNDLDGTD